MELLMQVLLFVVLMGVCVGSVFILCCVQYRKRYGGTQYEIVEDQFSPDSDSDEVHVIQEPISTARVVRVVSRLLEFIV